MKRGKNNKKKSTSREKYEKENPTVSAWVSKETRDRLLVNLAKLGMSLTDALKVLAGEFMKLYMVTYQCFIVESLSQ